MKRTIYTLSLLIACLCFAAPESFAHKYHTSVTRLEYNAEERSAEITIQTFTDDLEAILTKRAGRTIRLDASKDSGRLVLDYLQSAFELKVDGAKLELEWVGLEMKGGTAWLYVLTKLPGSLSKASLLNALLFDLFEDQVNIVNVLNSGKKRSLVFRRGGGMQELP
jgi:uncharacterized protein DUF6702